MGKIVKILGIILLVILILGFGIFALMSSKAARNKLFYQTGLVPKEIFTLSDKIDSVPPEIVSQQRLDLLKETDDFIRSTVSGQGFSQRAYSLVKIRLDKALAEIPTTQVPKGKVKLWYLYNMGVIAKTDSVTIAFDLPNSAVYSEAADFSKNLDILLITHLHGDHFDPKVAKAALANGVKVIVPDEKVKLIENGSVKDLVKDPSGEKMTDFMARKMGIKSDNLIPAKALEKITVKGVEITAYPANHTYTPGPGDDPNVAQMPVDWYYVNLGGVTFLDTGDGVSFNYQPDFVSKKIDVLITRFEDARASDNIAKLVLNPGIVLPLHNLELQHGAGIVDYMMYRNILEENSNGYWRNNKKARFIPLIWGESITVN